MTNGAIRPRFGKAPAACDDQAGAGVMPFPFDAVIATAGGDVREFFGAPARPGDDDAIDAIAPTDAERQRQLGLRQVARSALDQARLRWCRHGTRARSRQSRRDSTWSRSVAARCCGCRRAGRCGRAPAGPLLVVMSRSTSPSRSKSPYARPRPTRGCANAPPAVRRDVTERAVTLIQEQLRRLRVARRCRGCSARSRRCGRWRRRDRVAVEIDDRRTRIRIRGVLREAAPTPGCARDVLVERRAPRAIETDHLVVEVGDGDPGAAGVVEVAGIDTHPRPRLAVLAEGDAGLQRHVLERAVAQIPIQLVRLRVVGDEEIGPAVLVVVDHRHAERFRAGVEDAARGGDVLERAVAAVTEQPAGLAAIRLRRAVGLLLAVEAAEDVVLRRPPDVVADEQIEQAVAIEVEPQRGGAERLRARRGRSRA